MAIPSLRLSRFAAVIAMTAVGGGFVPAASAGWFSRAKPAPQAQERGLLDRLENPDRTLHYSPSDKSFAASSSATDKQAAVRSFAFSRPATLRAGDGAFTTRAFSDRERFRTKDFATRRATAADRGFAQTDKGFSTKGFDTREDRAAGKTAAVRGYVPGNKPYLIPGKRQDDLDDLYRQKNLDIDQVREILNKPGGSTDAPVQKIDGTPVLRAQAVLPSAAR